MYPPVRSPYPWRVAFGYIPSYWGSTHYQMLTPILSEYKRSDLPFSTKILLAAILCLPIALVMDTFLIVGHAISGSIEFVRSHFQPEQSLLNCFGSTPHLVDTPDIAR